MPEDRSLDEFAAATDGDDDGIDGVDGDGANGTDGADGDGANGTDGADGSDAATPAPEGGDADRTDATPDLDGVEPAAATYDHSPDGAACAACGATVTRRWRDDPGYVCEDCKEW